MIQLIKGYKYDNNYDYVKMFSTKLEQDNYFDTFLNIIIEDNEYIKENQSFNIPYDLDYLVTQGVNYLIYNNGFKAMYCFITNKEYVNDETTRIHYEVDVLQTFMFDFSLKESFIERKVCSLSELTEYDEGIEIGEHELIEDVTMINKSSTYFAMFSGFREYNIVTENSKTIDIQEIPIVSNTSRPTTIIDGIAYPLTFLPLVGEELTNFKRYLIDHPSLVGVVRFPNCSYTTTPFFIPFVSKSNGILIESGVGSNVASTITSVNIESSAYNIIKNALSDFYPYTYYTLTDGETEPIIMKPQYLPSSLTVKGRFALGHAPIEQYYPSNYKGSTNGLTYNITNGNQLTLPIGKNTGLETITNNFSSITQSRQNNINNFLIGTAVTGASLFSGNAVGVAVGVSSMGSALQSFNNVKENLARQQDLELTPSSIKSMGTVNTRMSFSNDNVRIQKWSIQAKYKTRLNNYVARYGNKFNNYATIDLKTYKGYLKTINVDVDSNIDYNYLQKIISIFERGVKVE